MSSMELSWHQASLGGMDAFLKVGMVDLLAMF